MHQGALHRVAGLVLGHQRHGGARALIVAQGHEGRQHQAVLEEAGLARVEDVPHRHAAASAGFGNPVEDQAAASLVDVVGRRKDGDDRRLGVHAHGPLQQGAIAPAPAAPGIVADLQAQHHLALREPLVGGHQAHLDSLGRPFPAAEPAAPRIDPVHQHHVPALAGDGKTHLAQAAARVVGLDGKDVLPAHGAEGRVDGRHRGRALQALGEDQKHEGHQDPRGGQHGGQTRKLHITFQALTRFPEVGP